MKAIISPSILNVKKEKMIESIKEAEKSGADWIHFDIMDGKFVPAISFSFEESKKYMENTSIIKDVHIMVSNPKEVAQIYCDYGANYLTFHLEACKDENEVKEVIQIIKNKNVKVGLSINPNTPVESLFKYVNDVDMILIMSVYPGKGGQTFINETTARIKQLKDFSSKINPNLIIEVDGGIKKEQAELCKAAGATALVAGTYIFDGDSIKSRIDSLNE